MDNLLEQNEKFFLHNNVLFSITPYFLNKIEDRTKRLSLIQKIYSLPKQGAEMFVENPLLLVNCVKFRNKQPYLDLITFYSNHLTFAKSIEEPFKSSINGVDINSSLYKAIALLFFVYKMEEPPKSKFDDIQEKINQLKKMETNVLDLRLRSSFEEVVPKNFKTREAK